MLSMLSLLSLLLSLLLSMQAPNASVSRMSAQINQEARVTGQKVAELIATATSVNVCLMPPTWHPWF